ncbi:MAG TPA: peptidase [Cyanobacteria bacterium UBA8803]|nr:peptidase [Cyanobacteria bacterium UBA9273]HBL62000.1 peptidase [Cyanobacteria bacterium UBA8803]
MRRQRSNWVKFSLALSTILAIAMLAIPARALQVSLLPNNPHLGDTLSILIQQSSTISSLPTVKIGQNTYPAYQSSSGSFRALVPTTPLDKPGNLQIQVVGEGETKTLTVPLRNRSFPTQRIRLSGAAGAEATPHELDRVAAFKKLETPEKFWNGSFLKPNQGSISAGYGIRRYYNGVFANDYYHRGVDYAGGTGSPVVAPAPGRIALVGRVSEGFRVHGNVVGIDHGQGVTSIMLHLSRIDVKEGDFVQAGQRIGAVGSTGAATGPHLHWGLYVHGLSVDPVPWRYKGFE